ncbi:hypothetical protein BT69DRAFT_1332614 [Atractiella rhizophila]|nr:hypothetical protein BT69DRAFT_1332614 [Atractiella rhizophila]
MATPTSTAQSEKEKGKEAFKKGDYPLSIGHYTRAMQLDPKEATYPLNRAMAYLKLNKFHDASRDCDTSLKLKDNNSKALFRRGLAKKGIGEDYPSALKDLEAARKLEPKNATIIAEIESVSTLVSAKRQKAAATATTSSLRPTPPNSPAELPPPASAAANDTTSSPSTSRLKAAVAFEPDSDIGLKEATTRRFAPAPATKEKGKDQEGGGGKKSFAAAKAERTKKMEAREKSHLIPLTSSIPASSSAAISSAEPTMAPNLNGSGTERKLVPLSASEFDRKWNALRGSPTSKEIPHRWNVLRNLPPASLPNIFGDSLEAETIGELLAAVEFGLQQDDAEIYYVHINEILKELPKTKRFNFVQMFLSEGEKSRLNAVMNRVGLQDSNVQSVWLS